TGLPPGLGINPATGVISGTPSASGNFTPVITVTDPASDRLTGQLPLVIGAAPVKISVFSTLPNGVVGVGYSGSVGASGGVDPLVFSLASGAVPPGLTFFSNGILSGTPTTVGRYTFTVRVTDGANNTDSREF